MKNVKIIVSVLLAALMALSMSAVAFAYDAADYNWERVPTSPDGLTRGLYFDFRFLLSDDMTEEQKTHILNVYNSQTWYVDLDADMVMCENGAGGINGIYSRSDQPYICALREVVPVWYPLHKDFAGIQVGDYYIDKDVFYREMKEGYFNYYAPQYYAQYPGTEMPQETRDSLEDIGRQMADYYYKESSFLYNPGGRIYRYMQNGMYAPYVRYLVDYEIAKQQDIYIASLDASIRVADAATVAASPWTKLAPSYAAANPGEYYIDFDDTAALMEIFNMTETPEQTEIDYLRNGEWYADFNRGVVSGKLTVPAAETGLEEDLVYWMSDVEELFPLVKIRDYDWQSLPYDADGLSEGDRYLDTQTFIDLIGKGKTEAEKAAVLDIIRSHVEFFYALDGDELICKYIYTELPVEDGDPVSGTVTLPDDLGTNAADAYFYDYAAIVASVRTYTAPSTEEPGSAGEQDEPNAFARFFARMQSIVSMILSFFRRLFGAI